MGQQAVLRVGGEGLRRSGAALLVGAGEHNRLVQLLHRPAVGDEGVREPIQQLGMGWKLAADPEVAGRSDQSRSEVVHPDPVDHDARRERIVFVCDRLRQFEASAAIFERGGLGTGDAGEEPARYALAVVAGVAANEDVGVEGAVVIDERHGEFRRGRRLFVKLVELCLKLRQRFLGRRLELWAEIDDLPGVREHFKPDRLEHLLDVVGHVGGSCHYLAAQDADLFAHESVALGLRVAHHGVVLLVWLGNLLRRDGRGRVRLVAAGEHAVERIVVLGADRIELMVVAARAGDREAH